MYEHFLIRDELENVYCNKRVQIKDFERVNIWNKYFIIRVKVEKFAI